MPKKASTDKRANSKKLKTKKSKKQRIVEMQKKIENNEIAIPEIDSLSKQELNEYERKKGHDYGQDPLAMIAASMKMMADGQQKTLETLEKMNEKLDNPTSGTKEEKTSIEDARHNLQNSKPLFYGKVFTIRYLKYDLSSSDGGEEWDSDPSQFESEAKAHEYGMKKYGQSKYKVGYISIAQTKNEKPDAKKFIRTI